MSQFTSIILITAIKDGAKQDGKHPHVDILNSFFVQDHGKGIKLIKVDGYASGSKVMQCGVFMAAIHHLNISDFLKAFFNIQWEAPESVQLMLKDEHDELFSIYQPRAIPI